MKYLRVIVSKSSGRPIYKKDFEPRNVFEIYTRELASLLIKAGKFHQGEYYQASFIPRYGHTSASESSLAPAREELKEWITLIYEDDVDPETSIDFFEVKLFPKGKDYPHRALVKVDELIHFWLSIEQLLVQIELLSYGEACITYMYARDDEDANFEREELFAWEEDASLLVEIVPNRNSTALLGCKALTDFHIIAAKNLQQDQLVTITNKAQEQPEPGLHILMTFPVLESVQKIARSGAPVEQGGVLVGDIYENAHQPGFLVAISGYIPAEKTFANEIELRYTFESWQRQKILLNERYPGKRIVGWYHTHLDLVKHNFYIDDSKKSMYSSSLFFSLDDTFTHSQFFSEKWYVAMVLNSEGNLIFFKWMEDEIVEERTFYLIGQEE